MKQTTVSTDRYIPIITAMLRDVQRRHSVVYTPRDAELDLKRIEYLASRNGMEFLTKDLPSLGKAFDYALTELVSMSLPKGFPLCPLSMEALNERPTTVEGSQLPELFRPLFSRVFNSIGEVLPNSDIDCVRSIRQLCFTFYKLELPYSSEEEQKVVDQFVKTESDISSYNKLFSLIADNLDYASANEPHFLKDPILQINAALGEIQPPLYRRVIRNARLLLAEVFQRFDPKAIVPKHGPGAVSTRERLQGKYQFRRINPRIDQCYPFSEYFLASAGALCDSLDRIFKPEDPIPGSNASQAKDPLQADASLFDMGPGYASWREKTSRYVHYKHTVGESMARVILVPKDSRGPRLISSEPLENQWIQQGLGAAIVRHVERHPLTRYNVHFTDQEPNRRGALIGSRYGHYATLDLKEASDRVTVGLVRLLFPEPLLECLMASRTTDTVLPSGASLHLDKFAPMGSALCFPILALTIWALVTALFRDDAQAKDSLLVYGDDVIVRTERVQDTIGLLEAFGLVINRAKSCFSGFFRESCGMDAFKGHPVTPVRVRTPWTSRPSPKSYLSWLSYANSFRRNGYTEVSDRITEWLCRLYGEVPSKDMMLNVPSLDVVPEAHRPRRSRINKRLQKREWYVISPRAQQVNRQINGWDMLLRYFSETGSTDRAPGLYLSDVLNDNPRRSGMEALNCVDYMIEPFSVRSYTPRDSVVLEKSWR